MPIFPPRLRPGDTVGVISPALGSIGRWPHRWETAQRNLADLGLRTRLASHAGRDDSYVSARAWERADDIHELFLDPAIRAVIASLGGDHSCQLLRHLDFGLIRENPKIFMGYSDVTVLNLALYHGADLVTFNGPSIVADLAEYPALMPYLRDCLVLSLFEGNPFWTYRPSPEWTDEFLDWNQKLDLTRPRRTHPNPGWVVLHPGVAEGHLLGGCIESLEHLRGTPFWPDWHDALFFWELSEQQHPPAWVDAILSDYENMGILSVIRGMMVGRAYGYSPRDVQVLYEVISSHTQGLGIPVVAGMDFGHTTPQFPLPIGALARLNAQGDLVRLTIGWGTNVVPDEPY
jgi:muramoyltetrapeptide carboxypeptidase LdcA involved in peptidoglycan recycling